MSILSITFHAVSSAGVLWHKYVGEVLTVLLENLWDVEKYILSEVDSKMLHEGSNTNALLVFESEEKRNQFLESEFINITERINAEFGDSVMIFETFLNPITSRF